MVLSFRSLAVGKIIFVNRPLIRYRRHGDNLSFHSKDMACTSYTSQVAKRQIALKRHINAYDAILADICTLEGMHKYDRAYSLELGQETKRVKRLCELELRFLTEGFGARATTMIEILKHSGMHLFTRLLPQLLPKYIYHRLRNFRQFVRGK